MKLVDWSGGAATPAESPSARRKAPPSPEINDPRIKRVLVQENKKSTERNRLFPFHTII